METQATRGGFVAGLRLVPECLRYMARMRNVWLVMACFAAVGAILSVKDLDRWWQDPGKRSFGQIAGEAASRRLRRWHRADVIVANFLRGVQGPLNARFSIAGEAVGDLADRILGPLKQDEPPTGLRLSFMILIADLIYAALTAGMLGWMLLAIRGEPLTARAFLRALAKSTGPIYCWFLLLDAVRLLIYGLNPLVLQHLKASSWGIQAASALLLLPFAFIPSVIVVRSASIAQSFPASLRVFTGRFLSLLAFLVCFRVAAEVVAVVDTVVLWSVPAHTASHAVAAVILFGRALLDVAISVSLCVGLLLLVLRTDPAPAAESQPAEAAPA